MSLFGFQSFRSGSNLQLDNRISNFSLISSGIIYFPTDNSGWEYPQTIYFPEQQVAPLIFLNAASGSYYGIIGLNSAVISMPALDYHDPDFPNRYLAPSDGVRYKIYGATQYNESDITGKYGLNLYNEQAQLTYSSEINHLKIVNIFPVGADSIQWTQVIADFEYANNDIYAYLPATPILFKQQIFYYGVPVAVCPNFYSRMRVKYRLSGVVFDDPYIGSNYLWVRANQTITCMTIE